MRLIEPGRYHFVGIGGAGMSALARLALAAGATVTGSDVSPSAVTEGLAASGALIYIGHAAQHVAGATAVVVSTAVAAANPEVVAARRLGLPVLHRSELLARFMARRVGIAVTGSHGKSTTAALIAVTLVAAGCDPTVALGGDVAALGGNARLGQGAHLVAEADESDGSFVRLRPQIAVVTNADDDHLDHFGTRRALLQGFADFLASRQADGVSVLCADDPGARALVRRSPPPVLTYGCTPGATVEAADVEPRGFGMRFRASFGGESLGRFDLGVPGRHNVLNALAALAVARHLDLDMDTVAGALRRFGGVGRRFEVLNPGGTPLVVDDYAHHPSEVRATLTAARAVHAGRIVVMFQPHRYSRTQLLAERFGHAFAAADQLLLTDVYPAGEQPRPGVSAELIAAAVRRFGRPPVTVCSGLDELVATALDRVGPGDLVFSMGAGNVRQAGEAVARAVTP